MNRKRVLLFAMGVLLLGLAIYALPLPSRFEMKGPVVEDTAKSEDSETLEVSIDAWILKYLFRQDQIVGRISLGSATDKVLDKVKIKVPLLSMGKNNAFDDNIYLFSFLSYDASENRYVGADVFYSGDKRYIAIRRKDRVYYGIADDDVENIIDLFNHVFGYK